MSDIDLSKYDELNNEYVRGSFREDENIEVTYDENYLVLGRDKYNGKLVGIDAKDAQRVIVLGLAGSGKTFLVRAFIDRAIRANQHCFVLNDCKDEFKSSLKPVQGKFRRGLLPNEEPKGMKVVTLRPTFFKKLHYGKQTSEELDKEELSNYKGNFMYSPDISRMQEAEFMTLFRVDEMSAVQQNAMQDIFDRMHSNTSDEPFHFEILTRYLEQLSGEIQEVTLISLMNRIKPVFSSYFHEEKWERNLVELLEKGFVPAINFENFDSFAETGLAYPQALIYMMMRELTLYMKIPESKRTVKRLWFIIDEASRFIKKNPDYPITRFIINGMQLWRRYGISILQIFQEFNDIPREIRNGSKYILVPGTIDADSMKAVMVEFNATRRHSSQIGNEVRDILNRVKKYEWILINREGEGRDKLVIIKPLSPLSHHMETGK